MVTFVMLLILFHHMEAILVGVISLVEPYIISKVTLWNEIYIYAFKPVKIFLQTS